MTSSQRQWLSWLERRTGIAINNQNLFYEGLSCCLFCCQMFTLVCQKGDVEGPALTLAVTASHEGPINQHRTSMFHRGNRSSKTKARRLERLNGILKCHLESLTVVLLFFLRSKSSVFISLSLVSYFNFPLKVSWPRIII